MIGESFVGKTRSHVELDGKPTTQRQKRRRLNKGGDYKEQKLNQELNRRNFLVDVSSVYVLIKRNITNKKLSPKLFTDFRLVLFNSF